MTDRDDVVVAGKPVGTNSGGSSGGGGGRSGVHGLCGRSSSLRRWAACLGLGDHDH